MKLVGNVFEDLNGNGVRDPSETGFANITVTFTEPGSGYVFSVSTDSNGTYTAFTSATEPSITVDVNESQLPAGYIANSRYRS